MKYTNYSGLFSFEFIKSSDNKLYFTEVNFRNDAYSYLLTVAGVNLPEMWYKQDICISNNFHEIYGMNESFDFKLEVIQKGKFLSWIKDLMVTTGFLLFNRKDLKPFFYKIIDFIIRYIGSK